MLVFAITDADVGYGAVRLTELRRGDTCDVGSIADGGVKIKTLMKVEPHPEPLLVHLEEPPKPCAEERDHVRIAVGEPQLSVSPVALARIESRSSDEECLVAEDPQPGDAFDRSLGREGRTRRPASRATPSSSRR